MFFPLTTINSEKSIDHKVQAGQIDENSALELQTNAVLLLSLLRYLVSQNNLKSSFAYLIYHKVNQIRNLSIQRAFQCCAIVDMTIGLLVPGSPPN